MGQNDSLAGKNILLKVGSYFSDHIIENVYLHFDKPSYLAGDTIYFNSYVIMGEKHVPSTISKVLNADFVNPEGKIASSIKLHVISGIAPGDFPIPDSLKAGYYKIKAYTNYMKNSPIGLFEKVIYIGSVKGEPIQVEKLPLTKPVPDIQFFPESGNLIAGVKSKVAFKAIDNNGKGIDIKGTVLDGDGKLIDSIKSIHSGMGYFYLQPGERMNYKAIINNIDGSKQFVSLPASLKSGIVMTINNDSIAKASVKIESNPAFYFNNKNQSYLLLIYSGGTIKSITLTLDTPVITLDILKRRLQTGIVRVTLMDINGNAICERLFFNEKFNELRLSLTTEKNRYLARGKMNFTLNAKDFAGEPSTGSFSIAVINEDEINPADYSASTILTRFLLTSDLKGKIENPNYYFSNISAKTTTDLDLIMLTNGYRRFTWSSVLKNNDKPIEFKAEQGLEIGGKVETLTGKPVINGSVFLLRQNGNLFLNGKTDNNGEFKFDDLVFNDTTQFVLSATKANGSSLTKIIYHKEKQVKTDPAIYQPAGPGISYYLSGRKKQLAAGGQLVPGHWHMLKEVKIRGVRTEQANSNSRYGFPDHIITREQLGYGGLLSVKMLGLYHRPGYFSKPPLIIIDGVEMPAGFDVNQINVGSIKSISVIQNASANGHGYEGVLAFTMNYGLQTEDMVATGILPLKVSGFYIAREFYIPKYGDNETINNSFDLRSTIYWNPNVKTDTTGNANFEFTNALAHSSYQVIIEGFDNNGNLGRLVYRYHTE